MIEDFKECSICKEPRTTGIKCTCICGKYIHGCCLEVTHECVNKKLVQIIFYGKNFISAEVNYELIDVKRYIKVVGSNWNEIDTLNWFSKFNWFNKPENIKELHFHGGSDMQVFEKTMIFDIYKKMGEYKGIFQQGRSCIVMNVPFFKWALFPKENQEQIVIPDICDHIMVFTVSTSVNKSLVLNFFQNKIHTKFRLNEHFSRLPLYSFGCVALLMDLSDEYKYFGFKSVEQINKYIF